MTDVSIKSIDSVMIPNYHRRAFSIGWKSPATRVSWKIPNSIGLSFVCILYMNKGNYRDCLLEIQYCDKKNPSGLSSGERGKSIKLIDKDMLKLVLEPESNGFELVEVQGRNMVKFYNYWPSSRPSETLLRNSSIGNHLTKNGVKIALMLCYPGKIRSMSDAEIVKTHMERVYAYCAECAEDGVLKSQIRVSLNDIEKHKQKIRELEESMRVLLDDSDKGKETLARYGLQFYGEDSGTGPNKHFAF